MHKIKRVHRIDYYLELIFEDDSVRAIDLSPHFKIDLETVLNGEPNTTKVSIHPQANFITWDNGTEISADFLYDHSKLIGWVDKKWGNNFQAWQPIGFNTAEIKVETNGEVNSSLFLDGIPFPALSISSASFGIHENTAWYHVPFPGDEGIYEPEWEEPQIVFETLKQLVKIVENALEAKVDVTINITEKLKETGRALFVNSISPRNASIIASRFKKNAT
jgi:hypothetical protein